MPRRGALNARERAEARLRSQIGAGHDMSAATLWEGKEVTALQARRLGPSPEMRAVVQQVRQFVRDNGGIQDTVIVDARFNRHPGCITVRWQEGPSPADVADAFAVPEPTVPQDFPVIPGWLSLRRDDEFDIRWQVTYGHPHEHPTSPEIDHSAIPSDTD